MTTPRRRKPMRKATARRVPKPGKTDRKQAMIVRAQLMIRGHTLKEVAERAGVKQTVVSSVIAGRWQSENVWKVIENFLKEPVRASM